MDLFDALRDCTPPLVLMTQVSFLYGDPQLWSPAMLAYRAALTNPMYRRVWYGPCDSAEHATSRRGLLRDCALFVKVCDEEEGDCVPPKEDVPRQS